MTTDNVLALVIRTGNFIGWLIFIKRTLSRDVPLSRTTRQIVCLVLGFGMFVFVLGSLATIGVIEVSTSWFISTIFAAFAGLAVWTIVLFDERGGVFDKPS